MKHVFAAALIIALSVPVDCLAMSPVMTVKGPPASVKMDVHKFGVHEIYLTLPARAPSYVPSPLKITLSRGSVPNIFQVDLAYKELPDGRIYFRVDVPEEDKSDYDIRVVEMTKGSTWYELFSGKLHVLPTDQASQGK
jgi:hypothetical protein